jgi:hypothetical protein
LRMTRTGQPRPSTPLARHSIRRLGRRLRGRRPANPGPWDALRVADDAVALASRSKPPQCDINATSKPPQSLLIAN